MLPTLIASAPTVIPLLCHPASLIVRQERTLQASTVSLSSPGSQSKKFEGLQIKSHPRRLPYKAGICAASLNARCAAEQTQTTTRQSTKSIVDPFQGTKTPKLDDGSTGSPPIDRGGGGGGGGGSGLPSSGGPFFFGLLLFLSYFRDYEEEHAYQNG